MVIRHALEYAMPIWVQYFRANERKLTNIQHSTKRIILLHMLSLNTKQITHIHMQWTQIPADLWKREQIFDIVGFLIYI
jgi:hypothetical protein